MLKKFKKLGLALLLPATAMVIATPLVLTSCNASESLVVESEKQNNENLVVDSTTSDQTQTDTQEKEKIVKTLESKVFSKWFLLREYFLLELVRKFVGFPDIKQNITTEQVGKISVKAPASKEFNTELTSGLLSSAIKVFNLDSKITNIEIKKESDKVSEFTIFQPGYKDNPSSENPSPYPYGALQIPITITGEKLSSNVLKESYVRGETTQPSNDFDLTIQPTIATFDELESVNVGLDMLYNSINNNGTSKTQKDNSHFKNDVQKLHDEFQTNINGKESVFEQALSYNLATQGGLVSYEVTLSKSTTGSTCRKETISRNKEAQTPVPIDSLFSIPFIPFEIKGDYTYYLDNYVIPTTKSFSKLSSTDLTNN